MMRDLVKVWALALSFGLSVVFMHIFMLAYSRNNTVIVTINDFGEANIELAVLQLIVVPIITVGYYLIWAEDISY